MKKNHIKIYWPKWDWGEDTAKYTLGWGSGLVSAIGFFCGAVLFIIMGFAQKTPDAVGAISILCIMGVPIIYFTILGIIRVFHFRLYIEDKKK